jgi:hypothetical protein
MAMLITAAIVAPILLTAWALLMVGAAEMFARLTERKASAATAECHCFDNQKGND